MMSYIKLVNNNKVPESRKTEEEVGDVYQEESKVTPSSRRNNL